jgi:hypothetical protein
LSVAALKSLSPQTYSANSNRFTLGLQAGSGATLTSNNQGLDLQAILDNLYQLRTLILSEAQTVQKSRNLQAATAGTGALEALWGFAEFAEKPVLSVLAFTASSIEELVNSFSGGLSSNSYYNSLVSPHGGTKGQNSLLEIVDSLIEKFNTQGINALATLSSDESQMLKNSLAKNYSAIFVHQDSQAASNLNAAIQLVAGLVVGYATLSKLLMGEKKIFPSLQNSKFCEFTNKFKERVFNFLSGNNPKLKTFWEAGSLSIPMLWLGSSKINLAPKLINPDLRRINFAQGIENRFCAIEGLLALLPEKPLSAIFPNSNLPLPEKIKNADITSLTGNLYGLTLTATYLYSSIPTLISAFSSWMNNNDQKKRALSEAQMATA